MSGSYLEFEKTIGGRGGGTVYNFSFEDPLLVSTFEFKALVTLYTSLEHYDYRIANGLPTTSDLNMRFEELRKFAETHGEFAAVDVFNFANPVAESIGPSRDFTGWHAIDWTMVPDEAVSKIPVVFASLYFELRSKRDNGDARSDQDRYYPDHLKFTPPGFPSRSIRRFTATDFGS